jgi:HlyD family secretion protein
MFKKKTVLLFLSFLLIVFVVIAITINRNNRQLLEVQTTRVEKQKIVQTVTATGRIQPVTQVKISADVAAKITRLEVKEGDWVEKGDFLVQLDRERFLAAVESEEAQLRATEANAQLAKENMLKTEKDFLRTKELFDKNLESQAVLDQIYAAAEVEKARYQAALEQVDQAKASLKRAQDDLSKTTLFAPMSGTISELNKEVGEIALGSQFQEDVIMVISNLSGMEALVDVDENDIVSLSIGDSAKIEVDALPDMVFKGTVSEIANSAKISGQGTSDQKTEFEVKIELADPGDKLRPGMTASSEIITEVHEQVLTVPIQSVTIKTLEQLNVGKAQKHEGVAIADDSSKQNFVPDKDGFIEVVWVIENGKTVAKQVKTGIQSDTHIEIREGLLENDEIVIGNYRAITQLLQNGLSVAVKNTTEKT